jgi:DNA-binding response OmpR family regulator
MRSVLIIDPSEDFRDLLRELFVRVHWVARVAESIGAAVAVVEHEPTPDLVMLDVDSYEMSASVRALRDVLPGVRYLVGMTTGFHVVQKPSAYDFIVRKPFDLNQVLSRVDEDRT